MADQSAPGTRRELTQRVQIGLTGLAAVLLVVAFANIVVKSIRPESTQPLSVAGQPQAGSDQANGAGQSADNEPLADLGVTPKSDQPSVGQSVPDLEPDPRLSKPMDHDPKKASAAQRR